MSQRPINLRSATQADLDAINHVIEEAVMTWNLPERVKRLSLPSYRYTVAEFNHFAMVVAEDHKQTVIGIAAWEPAETKDTPEGQTALLLHGIYVAASHHHQGIGRQLFQAAEQAARQHHYSGLLVKAQESASGFFTAQGMKKLPVENHKRHYANRFWKSVER